MFEELTYSYRLWRLQRGKRRTDAAFDRKIQRAREKKADYETINKLEYDQRFETRDFDAAIIRLQTRHLIRMSQWYLLPLPEKSDWVEDEERGWQVLSQEARLRLISNVRLEKKERWERWARWVPILGALTGLVGAFIGIVAILRH